MHLSRSRFKQIIIEEYNKLLNEGSVRLGGGPAKPIDPEVIEDPVIYLEDRYGQSDGLEKGYAIERLLDSGKIKQEDVNVWMSLRNIIMFQRTEERCERESSPSYTGLKSVFAKRWRSACVSEYKKNIESDILAQLSKNELSRLQKYSNNERWSELLPHHNNIVRKSRTPPPEKTTDMPTDDTELMNYNQKEYGQPYDFKLQVDMRKHRGDNYLSLSYIIPAHISFSRDTKGRLKGFYNPKTGRAFGLPTKQLTNYKPNQFYKSSK